MPHMRRGAARGIPPVRVAASLGQVTASMRQMTKQIGETLTIRVHWTPQTVDAQGNLISWPYRVRCQIRHQPWVVGRFETDQVSGTVTTESPIPTLFTFNAPDLEGILEILAFVQARPSKVDGTPDNHSWVDVDEEKLEGAYEIVAGAADPDASITNIEASQARPPGGIAFGDPLYAPRQYPQDYARATVRQGRPRGGFAFPEPNQYTRIGANPALPGTEIRVRQGDGGYGFREPQV